MTHAGARWIVIMMLAGAVAAGAGLATSAWPAKDDLYGGPGWERAGTGAATGVPWSAAGAPARSRLAGGVWRYGAVGAGGGRPATNGDGSGSPARDASGWSETESGHGWRYHEHGADHGAEAGDGWGFGFEGDD